MKPTPLVEQGARLLATNVDRWCALSAVLLLRTLTDRGYPTPVACEPSGPPMTNSPASMTTMQTIERLDYSKPPPGYLPHPFRSGVGKHQFVHAWVDANKMSVLDSRYAGPEEALAAAWTHYKESHDPPGMQVYCIDFDGPIYWLVQVFDHAGEHVGPRAGFEFREFASADVARATAWAWYDARLALAERLDDAQLDDKEADCEACGGEAVPPEALAEHEDVCISASHDVHDDGGGRCNTCGAELPACSTCGPYHGRRSPCEVVWPRCLTWSNEQVEEVERWLVNSTAETPEVLRG